MPKILINNQHGGFGLSAEATRWLRQRGYPPALEHTMRGERFPDTGAVCRGDYSLYLDDEQRSDALPIQCFAALGARASGDCCELKVVEVPDDVAWTIEEYDGLEWVAERHRVWR